MLGLATHPPALRLGHLRLEEIVYRTSRAALAHAGVSQRAIDHVTLGACDELDGRSISSMLLSAPAGAYLQDEIRVTDSGATALCLGAARIVSGDFHLGLVASWCKSSKTDVESVMRFRGDPFYTRPFGLGVAVTDALFAQAVAEEFGITDEEVAGRVARAYERAAANPRGMRHAVPTEAEIAGSEVIATPLRSGQRAPLTDGAVSMVLASDAWLRRHPQVRPLARLAGVGWATDSYQLGRDRLRGMRAARLAWAMAMRQAGLPDAEALDLVELDSQTGHHEAACVRALGLGTRTALSPSGGPFAQNPLFCSGLVNAAEAVLQVAGIAGPVQVAGARRAAAQGCHGFALQGSVVTVFEAAEPRHA